MIIGETIIKKPAFQSPFYPHFIIKNVPRIQPFDELSAFLKNELQKHGEIAKLELNNQTEGLADVLIGFTLDKDAVLALKSSILLHIGSQENKKSFLLEPTIGFKKYLTDLSSSLKLLSSTASNSQKGEAPKSQQEPATQSKNLLPSKKDEKSTMEIEGSQKIIIKGSCKKKSVPLEIIKPNKMGPLNPLEKRSSNHQAKGSQKKSPSRSRSRSATVNREKESSYKKRSTRKLTEDLSRDSRRERSKELYGSYREGKSRRKRHSFHEKSLRRHEKRFWENEKENSIKNASPMINLEFHKGKLLVTIKLFSKIFIFITTILIKTLRNQNSLFFSIIDKKLARENFVFFFLKIPHFNIAK